MPSKDGFDGWDLAEIDPTRGHIAGASLQSLRDPPPPPYPAATFTPRKKSAGIARRSRHTN